MAINAALIGTRGTSSSNTVTTSAGTSTGGSGNHGYLVVSFDPGVNISTVADSKSNTWTIIGAVVTGTAKIARYRCYNWTGGASHTATVTFSGTAFPTLHLIEVTGATSSTPVDVSTTGTDASSPYTLVSGALGQAAEVVMCLIEQNNGSNGSYAESSGFTILSQESNVSSFWTSAIAKKVVASTSSVTPSWTRTGRTAGTTALAIDTWKEASSSPTGTSATTNANDTSSASGTTTIVGASASTNANDASAASGTTTILGSSATTNANDANAASGTTTITGSSATTNANDASAASGSVGSGVSGTSATTNADDISAASGTTTVVGTSATTNAPDVSNASGTTPDATPIPHLIWGADFKRHYYSPLIRKLRREIPDEVFQVIAEVATPAVPDAPKEAQLNLYQQELLLRAELKAQGIAWKKVYKEALAEILAQEDEDRAILMLLSDL